MSATHETVYRRRHDIYYITLLAYVVFAVAYVLITGTVTDDTVQFGVKDPVVYIIGAFILHAVVMLCVNVVRNRRLVFTSDGIVLRDRFRERRISFQQLRSITLTRERPRFNDGTFALVTLRVAGRRRPVRIWVASFERETELLEEFKTIKEQRGL